MTLTARPTAVIVDPFGSGSYLAPIFDKGGWDCIAVLSSPELPSVFTSTMRPEAYVEILTADNGLEAILQRLTAYTIVAVLPGMETGVELSDVIASLFGVPGNGTACSRSRRDKAAMGARLHLCGVPAAEQILTTDESTLVNWAIHHGKWPVVVKPTLSAGSDSVAICQTVPEVRAAFQSIIGKTNKLGAINDAVLGQEFLEGQQYLVNTVSVEGKHYVGEIWSFDSTFEGAHQVYDRQLLLPPNGQLQDQLVSYVYQVLDALEIRHGAAHTEVMLTRAGPRLIESAARMTGKIGQATLLAAIGHHHISLCADCCLEPDKVLARMPRYKMHKAVGIVALRSSLDGHIHDGRGLSTLLALPTLVECIGGRLEPGTPVCKTVDLFTSPGLVYLLGSTFDEIDRDALAIRRIEASGDLYVARSSAP